MLSAKGRGGKEAQNVRKETQSRRWQRRTDLELCDTRLTSEMSHEVLALWYTRQIECDRGIWVLVYDDYGGIVV